MPIDQRCSPISKIFGAEIFSTGNRQSAIANAFTLIELILVMALIIVAVSLVAPRMSGFMRGRALDSEARQLFALIHEGQSRAVSEGMPMVLWVDEKQNAYGLEEETPGKNGDPEAENLTVNENLQLAVVSAGSSALTTFHNLPAIRFLPDGTIDENSPQKLRLTDGTSSLWLIESRNRMSYEIQSTDK
ncbi:MAG: GspH/FimT family pseudopilin [Limisphaerales bacterium]